MLPEVESSCGDNWSANRLYLGMKSNNSLHTYEYLDFPMSPERCDVKPGEHNSWTGSPSLLNGLSKNHGVFSRTKFNTKVESLEPTQEGGWSVMSECEDGKKTFETKKVVVATGLTSKPNFPVYSGAETFGAPPFHTKDCCRNGETIKTAECVVIFRGAKSAMDVAYAYAVEGVQVDLVVRPDGKDPV